MIDNLLSEDDVKQALNMADSSLHECFDMLIDFRSGQNDLYKVIWQFQPLLAETLFNLMEFYNKLSQEKSRLISVKSHYDETIFSKAMAKNRSFMKAVSAAIGIGKSMGDAFVWFFYRNNREELEKHFEHTSTGLYVSGIGGRGELEFIKKTPHIEGCYVLYHGITTVLRIGDFSLYDMKHGIVGLGELKTKKEGNNLQISAFISSKVKIKVQNQSEIKQDPFEERLYLVKKDFPRIEKQLREQINFLKTKKEDTIAVCKSSYEYNMVNSITPETPLALSSDKSLMIIATWSKYQTMYDVLTIEESPELPKDALIESVETMLFPESPYNQVHIGRLNTELNLLTIPILWWDINDRICRDIYFLRIGINTIFNPSKLLNYFTKDGFSVEISKDLNKIKIRKKIGANRISFENFESLCYLITNSFMTSHDAYSLAKPIWDKMEKGAFPINSKIEMHIDLNNFGMEKSDILQKNECDRKEWFYGQTENAHAE